MATTQEWIVQGTAISLLTTELNAAATSAIVTGSGVNNVQATSNLNGYTRGRFELIINTGHTISNAGAINVWLLTSRDGGTTYERGSSAYRPNRPPDFTLYPGAEAGTQCLTADAYLPPGYFKACLELANLGAAAALAATGNTFKVNAFTPQQV